MALEGDLGKLSLNSVEAKKTDISSAVQIENFDDAKKTDLKNKLFDSAAGEKLKTKLDAIKAEINAEQKKTKLVDLMKDFFNVESGDDEHIQRLVDEDGKSYLRLDMGEKTFDIQLTDALIPEVIDRYIAQTEAVINEWADDANKIKLHHEKATYVQTKKELDALKTQVSTWSSTTPAEDFRSRETFKKKPAEWFKKVGPWINETVESVKDFFKSLPETFSGIAGAFGSVKGMFGSVVDKFKK